jgi:hypothetical protein
MNINEILSTVEQKIVQLAKDNFKDLANDAITDGKQLLTTIKDDLVRRTQLLADKKITPAEFNVLILADEDLVEMTALTDKGLALAKIDAFKNGVFKLIIDTVISLI